MITKIEISNFGPIEKLSWQPKKLNVIIGKNGSGKTFLMKAMYATLRAVQEASKSANKEIRSSLEEKLLETFLPDKIGDLANKKGNEKLSVEFDIQEIGRFAYSFSKTAEKGVGEIVKPEKSLQNTNLALFMPAKELLSLSGAIKDARANHNQYFDSTYMDLFAALEVDTRQGKNWAHFATARDDINDILGGRLEYVDGNWRFRIGNMRFPISLIAEGHRRTSSLERLLGNRMLTPDSVLFIDEPDANLHPEALVQFMKVLQDLSREGMQIFLSTHSYIVMKYLDVKTSNSIEQTGEGMKGISLLCLHPAETGRIPEKFDLADGMPNNEIIDAAIGLYEERISSILDGHHEL